MRNFKLVAIIIATLIFCISCSQKQKRLPGKYISLMEEFNYAKIDEQLANKVVNVPKAVENVAWSSSDYSLSAIPENILINDPEAGLKFDTANITDGKNLHTASKTPVIANNVMYATSANGYVYAYALDNFKKPLWKAQLDNINKDNTLVGGGVVVVGGKIAVTTGNKYLYVLNSADGALLWQYELSNVVRSTPVIKGDKIFVLTIDNRLYCLGLDKGNVLWTHEGAVEQFSVFGAASPAIADNLIIVPHSSGQLLAINIGSGDPVWTINLIKSNNNNTMLYLNDIDMTPVVRNGVIYVSNYAGSMFAIRAVNGEMLWINDSAGGNKFAWIAGDYIYAVNKYSQLVAVYKPTGQLRWATELVEEQNKKKKKNNPHFFGPLMANGKLYLTNSEGNLVVVDPANGGLLSNIKTAKALFSPPIAVNGHIYYLNNSGNLSFTR